MRLQKSFQLALNILLHSKLRSWLTIIGIVIGIAAVVSIVSISQGAQQQLQDRLGGLGADVLTVTPGFRQAQGFGGGFRGDFGGQASSTTVQKNLTSKDILVLKSLNNVKYVLGQVSGREEVTYTSKTATISITGVDVSVWKDVTTEKIASGRFLVQSDSFSVVLGGDIVKSTFPDGIPLNSNVIINGKSFKVVGITQTGRTAYIPIEIARTVIDSVGEKEFNTISVKLKDVNLATETTNLITSRLMMSRGEISAKDQDFTVTNPADIQASIQQTLGAMSLFLGAIAAISLLVGAIGIANTMFTSVLEKTREIGIMKAIGAKNSDILSIFLINSGLIGFVGGFGGVILGYIGSGLIGYLGSSMGGGEARLLSSTLVTPSLVALSLFFSVIIGMIAGAIPAYRASRLNPVDALRYE